MIPGNFVFGSTSFGLNYVCRHRDADVEYCGVLINVGSRDEAENESGIAHFIEHTIFKGTPGRRAASIISCMENIGGELNAYTTKEETSVYSVFPAGGLARAVGLIGDLVVNSNFPEQEIDKERDVILDELESYLDTPSEAVFDDFDELFFAGNSLAHNILGDYNSVKSFTPEMCRNFLQRFYTASNMIFFYAGRESADRVGQLLEKGFRDIPVTPAPISRTVPQANPCFEQIKKLNTHQSHSLMGTMTRGMFADNRYQLALLTNILGGPGMNSRLNIALRERRGLVYMVDANTTSYTDCGLFSVYFGCDHGDLRKCIRIVRNEIARLADKELSPRQLAAYKKQYIGQMTVARDNNEQSALSMARAFLYHRNILSPSEIAERINGISASEIKDTAGFILDSGLSLLTLG